MKSAAAVEQAATFAVTSNIVTNFFIGVSLQQVWSMINTQQIIVFLPLFKTSLPVNITIVFQIIMSIAAFDIIETQAFYDTFIVLPYT